MKKNNYSYVCFLFCQLILAVSFRSNKPLNCNVVRKSCTHITLPGLLPGIYLIYSFPIFLSRGEQGTFYDFKYLGTKYPIYIINLL